MSIAILYDCVKTALGSPIHKQARPQWYARRGSVQNCSKRIPASTKLVRCTRGAILDLIVDLRPESDTYLQQVAVELNEDNQRALYVPERFAHVYQTLRDDTDTSCLVNEFYTPNAEGGLMYNEPRLGLEWPLPVMLCRTRTRSSRRSIRSRLS